MNELKNKSGVYKITNLINGKIYVGSAIDLYRRRYDHFRNNGVNDSHNKYLNRSFAKYGVENFVFEVLEYCEKEDLLNIEDKYIKLFEVNNRDKGYNICFRAGSTFGYKHKEETKKKISKSVSGETNYNYGKKGSAHHLSKKIVQLSIDGEFVAEFDGMLEAERQIGISQTSISAVCLHKDHIAYGYRWYFKEEYEKINGNIPKVKISKKEPRIVYQLTLDGVFIEEFKSISKAGEYVGLSCSNISLVCMGKRKTASGFRWIYKEDYEKLNGNIPELNYNKKNITRSVIQMDFNGKIIKEFDSIMEANRKTGVNSGNISKSCKNKYNTAGGYKWIYKEDYELWINGFIKLKYTNSKPKPVIQFSKSDEFIGEFNSISEAERETGIRNGAICRCCKGKRKTAGGFKWKYKNITDTIDNENIL